MTTFTVSRQGAKDGAGDPRALFLVKFAGEVLTAFLRKTVMMDRHLVKTLTEGKTAQFPATWRSSASYHVPGNELVAGTINHNERTIHLDYPLTAQEFLAQWDDLVNHYDARSIYTTMQAEALANTFDRNVLVVLALAAQASATVSGGNGGKVITNANAATNGEVLADIAFEVQQNFDEKDVPEDGRSLFVKPAQYYLLNRTTKVLNKDWGGAGSFSQGTVPEIAGLQIVKTNNVPTATIAATPTGAFNTYHGTFANTVALAGHKTAVGSVKRMDVTSEIDWIPLRQAWLLISKMITGTGILRPECAVEIETA